MNNNRMPLNFRNGRGSEPGSGSHDPGPLFSRSFQWALVTTGSCNRCGCLGTFCVRFPFTLNICDEHVWTHRHLDIRVVLSTTTTAEYFSCHGKLGYHKDYHL
jgi:hypothetical protein